MTTSVYAQFSADKTYIISNNADNSKYMYDNDGKSVGLGGKNENSYWKFISTGNADCYYIQNAKTGRYIQGYTGSEQEVVSGDNPVEYYVKADASGNFAGKYRFSCTAN